MGSRATADRRVMRSVLKALPEGMYFIDSKTVGSSVASEMAKRMNIRTAVRHVFLDHVPDEVGPPVPVAHHANANRIGVVTNSRLLLGKCCRRDAGSGEDTG